MTLRSKTRPVLVTDKATIDLATRKVAYHRESLKELNKADGWKFGLGSYVLYGIDFPKQKVIALEDYATSAEFKIASTMTRKAEALKTYDLLVELRETGRAGHTKVEVLVYQSSDSV